METRAENSFGADQIPEQKEGTGMDAEAKIVMASEAAAIDFFKTVKTRLLDVNRWAEIAGIPMSTFVLTDHSGKEVDRKACQGDFLKINIPGPGTETGEGYDWVVIEKIEENAENGAELLTMTVRPAGNPLNTDPGTAHFLTSKATSTFQVKRVGNTIYAEEHGRNELANTDTGRTMDNLRNALVGLGAKMGFSYPQWKALVKGLISTKSQ